MALIKCKECGREISDKAKSCPYCGIEYSTNEIKVDKKSYSSQIRSGTITTLIANSFVVLFLFWAIITMFVPSSMTNGDAENDSSSGLNVHVELTPSYIDMASTANILISLGASIICFVLAILYLANKFKNIKLYKILMLVFSLINFLTGIFTLFSLGCCGIVYIIFPIINIIGAIIIVSGKINENN